MNRYIIIDKIEREKELSLQWVEKMRDIIEGKSINTQYLPIDITSFSFDYLFSGKFDELSVNQLELKYKKIHSIYGKIFQSYFEIIEYPHEGSLNYKCKNVGEKEKVLAMENLVFLEAVSKEFIACLCILEENATQKVEAYSCLERAS
jgi:hypothetical protein